MINNPISVFMHPRTFWNWKFSGVSRYVCELAEELIQAGVDVHIPIKETHNEYLKGSTFYHKTSSEVYPANISIRIIRKLLSLTPLKEKARRAELRSQALNFLRSNQFSLIHPTHTNATEILPYVGKTPLVITVHDMTHELFPESFATHDPSSERKRLFAQRADRIIAISECTKNDLVQLFDINPEKIDVIHHGNSLKLPKGHESIPMNLPERYVLFVGKRSGYKNFETFAKAFAISSKQDDSLHLICAGGGAFTEKETAFLEHLGIQTKTHQMWVTDEELAILYNRSLCFIYPSEYEGFGLPILEAFECGAPVLCAHASCFPEVAGNGALFFDPKDIQEMAALMQKVISSSTLRTDLLKAGSLRLKDFSWKKCAQQTLRTYKTVLQ